MNMDMPCGCDHQCRVEPALPAGVTYGGRGPGGEYYSKDTSPLASISLWTEQPDGECWTVEELEAIAAHKRAMEQPAHA